MAKYAAIWQSHTRHYHGDPFNRMDFARVQVLCDFAVEEERLCRVYDEKVMYWGRVADAVGCPKLWDVGGTFGGFERNWKYSLDVV